MRKTVPGSGPFSRMHTKIMASILDPSTSYNIKMLLVFQCISSNKVTLWYFCPINTSENLYHHSSYMSQKRKKKKHAAFFSLVSVDLLPCMFQMFPCSNTPDLNDQLTVKLSWSLRTTHSFKSGMFWSGKHLEHTGHTGQDQKKQWREANSPTDPLFHR